MSWTSELQKEVRQWVNDEMIKNYRAIDYKDVYNMMALVSQVAKHNKEFAEDVKQFLKSIMREDK